MSNPEHASIHPIWEGAIVGFLGAIESGMVPQEKVVYETTRVCQELLMSGMLGNLGVLQTYLRQRDAAVQLAAYPFKPEEMPRPDVVSKDPATGETRSHCLMVSLGPEAIQKLLQTFGVSHEVNEATLTYDTGILITEPNPQ